MLAYHCLETVVRDELLGALRVKSLAYLMDMDKGYTSSIPTARSQLSALSQLGSQNLCSCPRCIPIQKTSY